MILFLLNLIINIYASSYEHEKALAIKSIKVLSTDNTKGVYSKLVEPFVEEYFANQARFYYYGFSYINLLSDEEELFNYNVDSVLLLELSSVQDLINIELSLYVIKTKEKFVYEFSSFKKDNTNSINKNDLLSFIKKSLNKIPFKAIVLSRFEDDILIIDLGKNSNIKTGTTLNVYKTVSVNKHPYLNTIISLERQKVGEIKIFKVEENISFAKIIKENNSSPILEFYKIFIDSYPNKAQVLINKEEEKNSSFLFFEIKKDELLSYSKLTDSSLGKYSVSVPFSILSYKVSDKDSFNETSSFSSGFKLAANIFLKENWLLESNLKYQMQSFTPPNMSSSILNSSFRDFYLYLVYKLDVNYNNTLFFKSGYRNIKFKYDDNPLDSPYTNKKYQAFIFTFNYELLLNPFVDLNFDLYLSLYDSLNETPSSYNVLNNNIFGFAVNSNYKLNLKQSLIYGFYYDIVKTAYKNSDLISSSIANKGVYLGVAFVF